LGDTEGSGTNLWRYPSLLRTKGLQQRKVLYQETKKASQQCRAEGKLGRSREKCDMAAGNCPLYFGQALRGRKRLKLFDTAFFSDM
jgi:hypothetical protein